MLNDEPKYKMMMNKLMIQFNNGHLPDNPFYNSFLPRVWKKIGEGRPLSDLEKVKIEEIFDQN